jgi:hypothetical protein
MVKKILVGMIVVIFMFLSLNTRAQELNISFTPIQISGAHYAPNYILAIWIKDANNNYIRTLMVYAKTRKSYLYSWKSNSGGDVTDAITGATVSSYKAYTVTWNLKDYKSNIVPDGNYKLCMEMTSEHAQGPYREIDFTVGGGSYSLSPSDGQNFKSVSLSYTGAITGIETAFQPDKYLKIFPNPSEGNLYADIFLEQNSETTISIYNLANRLVLRKKIILNEGSNQVDLSNETNTFAPGVYLFLVETNHYTIGNKFMIR